MRSIRFTIANLLALVLFLAVAFAALRQSTDLWDSAVFSMTIGALLVAGVLGVHRHGRERAFWLGFALFGWAYLGASLVPAVQSRLITSKGLAYLDSKRLAFTRVASAGQGSNGRGVAFADVDNDGFLDLFVVDSSNANTLYRNVGNGTFLDVTASSGIAMNGGQAGNTLTLRRNAGMSGLWTVAGGTSENFLRIGHVLLALVMAYLGGRISRHFALAKIDDAIRDARSQQRPDTGLAETNRGMEPDPTGL